MAIPSGANVPGVGTNYDTNPGKSGGAWDWFKGVFKGSKVTVTSKGGGTYTYGGFTYIWGDGEYHIDPSQRQAAMAAGNPETLSATQQAGMDPQYILYAVVGAVLLYFMVKK